MTTAPGDDMSNGSDGVHIPLMMIYQQLQATDSKVNTLTDAITGPMGIIARLEDHERRLKGVESGRWPLPAAAALIALAALIWQILQAGAGH